MKSDPSKFHFIRRGTVLSGDRFFLASTEQVSEEVQLSDDDHSSVSNSGSSLCHTPFTAQQYEAMRKCDEKWNLKHEQLFRKLREKHI